MGEKNYADDTAGVVTRETADIKDGPHSLHSSGSSKEAVWTTENNTQHRFDRTQTTQQGPSIDDTNKPIDPPPNGGFVAWLHVFLCHLMYANTFGVANSFGVFQQYYTTTLGFEPSTTSWIGGLQMSLLLAVGVLAGRAVDAGYFRTVFLSGIVLQLLGTFLTSLCTRYWQILLAQGLAVGLGNGLIFTTSLSVMSTYFTSRRALAIGIAAAGSATGGLIYPIMVDQLLFIGNIGFPWTIRAVGFVMLAAHLPGVLFYRARIPYRKGGPLVEWAAFKETQYTLGTASFALCFFGILFPFFYIGTFAQTQLGSTYSTSVNLLITTNASGLVGRILPNFLAGRTGLLNMVVPFGIVASLLVYAWEGIHSISGLYVFASLYGVAAGALQSLYPALAASLTTDLTKAGTRLGMIMTILSVFTLTGPPIVGAIIQAEGGSYTGARAFSATVMLLAALLALVIRVLKVGWDLKKRA